MCECLCVYYKYMRLAELRDRVLKLRVVNKYLKLGVKITFLYRNVRQSYLCTDVISTGDIIIISIGSRVVLKETNEGV